MPILYRFLIVFGAIIAAGAVQSATAVLGVRNLSGKIDAATAIPIAQVDGAWRASEAFRESELFLKGALEGLRDQPKAEMIAQFEAVSAPITTEMMRATGGDAAPATDPNAEQIVAAITQWQADARILLGATPAMTIPAPHVMDKRSAAIHAGLQTLIADTLHKAAGSRTAIHAEASRTQTFAMIYAAVFVLVGIGAAVPFALSLTRPLRRLQRRMLSMMDGDMDSPILDNDRRDEVGSIAKALLFMRETLTERQSRENEAAMQRLEQEQQVKAAEAARIAAEQEMIVTSLATGLERLADGDLTFQLAQVFPAGYETLRVNFNNTTRQLQEMITGITDTTDALRSGTKDITQAADDLSRRTGAQAETLAETAASLEQIMTIVRKTADGAKQARDGVSQTKTDAEQSGEVVRKAIAAMSVIEQSSREISQIIGVIDEIAFQTNLLALNAGVEAARAGESGRGFAVVASEVRALAQRSLEAAKQIKTLILTSTQQVDTGVKLVGQTGQVLGRIEAQVGKVAGVVAEIAAAAELQANSRLGVNTALNQMGHVTQQNASMAKESNAASHSLAQETAELARLTSGFQLSGAANDAGIGSRRADTGR